MGRPSKLSDRQKAEIIKRKAAGEPAGALAKEFGLSRSRFHALFTGQAETVQKLATTLAKTELEIEKLPQTGQVSVRDLANDLKGITQAATRGGKAGMNGAAKLLEIYDQKVGALPANPSTEDLRPIAALAETAQKGASLGLALMQANKDANKEQTGKPTLEDLITGGKG
jgi:hypothetical protein